MTSKEKQAVVSLIGSVLLMGLYSLYIYRNYLLPQPGLINDLKFWGTTFLVMIPLAIAGQIILHIVFAIFHKIFTREDLDEITDERDKAIELKAMQVSHWLFIAGFVLAMGSQAAGMQPWVMFVTLIGGGFIASVIADSAKIYFYRKGI